MGAAVALGDVVGEGKHGFVVGVVPPHRDFHADAVLLAQHVDGFGHDRGLGAIEVFDEFLDAAFVEQLGMQRFGGAFVFDDDADAGIEEGEFAQAGFQRLEAVFEVGEGAVRRVGLGRGEEADLCPALAGGGADRVDMGDAFAMFEPGAVFGVVAPDRQFQPFRQGVDD